jgi:HEAT repeat protein
MKRWPLYLGVLIACVAIPLVFVGCKSATEQAKAPSDKGETKAEQAKAEQKGDEKDAPKAETSADVKKLAKRDNPEDQQKSLKTLSELVAGSPGEIRDTALQVLRDLATTDANPNMRAGAVGALAPVAAKEYATLRKAAKDPDGQVRAAAAQTLALVPGAESEGLLNALAADPDATTRKAATAALTAMRAAQTGGQYGALIAQLGQEPGDAAAQAAIALTLQADKALDALISCLKSSKSAKQRHGAAICIAMICAGTNPTQQNFARLAKATSRDTEAPRPANLRGLQPLIDALQDPEPMVREISAQGLGYLGDQRAAGPLAAALADPDGMVRRRAAAALITVPPTKESLAALAHAVTADSEAPVRRFAAEALGWSKDPASVEPLIKAASDKSPEVRRYAAAQLGRLGDRRAIGALVALFKDPDDDVRWAAVLAAGSLRDKQAEDGLVMALNDSAPQVANAAERALQRLGVAKRKLEPSERGYTGS